MFRTSNPAMNPEIFAKSRSYGLADTMTLQGTVNKCFILFFLLMLTASWIWGQVMPSAPIIWESGYAKANMGAAVGPYIMLGLLGGFILALVTVFKLPWARFTAPAYALCEGLVLGGISAIFEQSYPGIVIQAVSLTFATLFCMLMVYKTGLIKVTNKFVMGLSAATGAICLVYLGSWILGFFGIRMPFIYGNGPGGILFSFVVVGIAALNLILDFHIIEQGAQSDAPKYMEWYGAFALMVTLIWLYIEILRLLAKMRDRR